MKKNNHISENKIFQKGLLDWNKRYNVRQMPWKGEKDPYKIWLSEIILQQTRVEQGLSYYSNFVTAFPDIHKLAGASDEKVFKLWEGLGYYSRCRNLLFTARYISAERKGKFPDTYDDIRSLKGIGPYTAAAISSFAFNLPYAVVDGNVYRVLARYFGLSTPTDSNAGKKAFNELANAVLDKKNPGIYNQAIMDFGAVVCKPAAPLCVSCVFRKTCLAFNTGRVLQLPVKEKKTSIRKRWMYYLVAEYRGQVAIQQRTQKDIWQGLFEFPLVETGAATERDDLISLISSLPWLRQTGFEVYSVSALYKQQLSHQLIAGQFVHLKLKKKPISNGTLMQWVKKDELKKFAWPRFINQYLENNGAVQSLI
ncbi:MAG: A/G-specific adenine glycosylase [Bacteroidetes bacterium]|nr:A/G-specific adenine glycosylase [Bacteroidota bacterium]